MSVTLLRDLRNYIQLKRDYINEQVKVSSVQV